MLLDNAFNLEVDVYQLLTDADSEITLAMLDGVVDNLEMVGEKFRSALDKESVAELELFFGNSIIYRYESDRNTSRFAYSFSVIVPEFIVVLHTAFVRIPDE